MSTLDLKSWAEGIPGGIKWKGAEGQIHCPFHEDTHPSCSINIEKEIFNCHACGKKGTLRQLASRLGIEYPGNNQNPETIYPYTNEKGETIYEAVRYYKNGEKQFFARRPDGHGGYINNLKGIAPLPYRLPALLRAISEGRPIFILEGERDVKTLWDLGQAATCNHGGAGKWKDCHSKWIPKGTNVYICGDADIPGQKHVNKIAGSLKKKGCYVKIINFDYPIIEKNGKDITNWIAEGHKKEEFEKLIDNARTHDPAHDELESEEGDSSIESLLAGMDDIEYEAKRKELAKKLKMRVSVLDQIRKSYKPETAELQGRRWSSRTRNPGRKRLTVMNFWTR